MSNTFKQFVGNLPTNYFSVFDHFVKLALKGLKKRNPVKMWQVKHWLSLSIGDLERQGIF